MVYKILADTIVFIHFLWIIFMIAGFVITVYSICFRKKYLNIWLFRVLHLCGILYVGLLTVLDKYCPLTILEYNLRRSYDSQLSYPGSFIINHIEKLVYPDVNPLIIQIPTVLIAISTVLLFILFPPKRKGR